MFCKFFISPELLKKFSKLNTQFYIVNNQGNAELMFDKKPEKLVPN